MRIYQVPSHTRLWLGLALLLCALPQLLRGPGWQAGLFALVFVWRLLVDRQRIKMPGRLVRTIMLLATVTLSYYSYGRLYGPEAGVALLVALFALKYLEVVRLRDAYVLIVLGYFVCATSLLFSRGPGSFIFVLVCMTLLTACLVGINDSDTRARSREHLKRAAIMMLQSLPLMAALFILVPRVAPLWNMQLDSGKARTGMSDAMAPGQVSDLSQSAALAFRVAFEDPAPPASERYWRGLTLSHFDGRTWRQAIPRRTDKSHYLYAGQGPQPDWYRPLQQYRSAGPSYRYRVVMEPTQRRWMYALAVPFLQQGDAALARDMRLVAEERISQQRGYRVVSVPAARRGVTLSQAERELMLSLPDKGGQRARKLAQQWQSQHRSPRAVVQQALRYFRERPFHYTLQPPPLPSDSIDGFLFRTQRGFCEHYASSFTFLMRAAGIPARVVVGYQGGERNELGGHLLVRQYDAHAWAEVWLDEQGWVRVDPTAAVAPDRIEYGLQQALENAEQEDFASNFDFSSFAGSGVMGQLRQWMDYVDFRWQTWVLGYDSSAQFGLLSRFLGSVTPWRLASVMLAILGLMMLGFALFMFTRRGHARRSPLEREYWQLHERARQQGLGLVAGTAPGQLANAVGQQWPDSNELAQHWARYYETLVYRDGPVEKAQIRHLRRIRRRLYGRLR